AGPVEPAGADLAEPLGVGVLGPEQGDRRPGDEQRDPGGQHPSPRSPGRHQCPPGEPDTISTQRGPHLYASRPACQPRNRPAGLAATPPGSSTDPLGPPLNGGQPVARPTHPG